MRILFYQWHSFMNEGVERVFNQLGVKYDTFFFQQTDWETDTGIVSLLEKKLKEKEYDIVFSVNYAPLVSMVCQREQILYVSWVYDAPIHIRDSESMKNSCNRIFFFDRIQAEGYASCGIAAYHMPLAADVETFQQYKAKEQYRTDISLVGKLYQTEYNYEEENDTEIRFWNSDFSAAELLQRIRRIKYLLKRLEYDGFEAEEGLFELCADYSVCAIAAVYLEYVVYREKVYDRILLYYQKKRMKKSEEYWKKMGSSVL